MGIETNAYLFGWNRPISGRENVAGELFQSTVAYFDKLQKNGKLEGYETVFLAQHGGDLNGFFYLRGTHQNLQWVAQDDEFVDIQLRAGHCLEGVGFTPAYRGNAINEMMTRWTKTIPR
jgi:hypothetical protein